MNPPTNPPEKRGERLKSGDVIDGKWKLGAMLSYQGKEGCTDPRCGVYLGADGEPESSCRGYHCAVCHEPCSMVGHKDCA